MKWKEKSIAAALLCCVLLLPGSAGAAETSLEDFESYKSEAALNKNLVLWQDTGVGVKWSISQASYNDGGSSLKVEPTKEAAGWNVVQYLLPEGSQKDWTDYQQLSFWIHNESDAEFNFVVEIDDAASSTFEVKPGTFVYLNDVKTQQFSNTTKVPAGYKGTVKIPLENLSNVNWQGGKKVFDQSQVRTIKVGYSPKDFKNIFYLDSFAIISDKESAAQAEPAVEPAVEDKAAVDDTAAVDDSAAAEDTTAAAEAAGDTDVDAAAAEPAVAAANPATGDSGVSMYVMLALVSLLAAAGFVLLRRRLTKS